MKRSILALMAIVLFTACQKNENADANLHITGTIKGLKQGTLYIKRVVDTAFVAMDTIVIKGNPNFESHLKIDSPEMLYLFLDRGKTNSTDDNVPFFAEPGNIRIEANNEEFFYRAKVTGSENHKMYEEFLKIKSRFTDERMELLKKNIEATKNSNVAQLDSVAKKTDQMTKRRYLYTINFALNHAKNDVGPYIAMSEVYDANLIYLDTIRKSMSPAVAKSKYGKMLTKFVDGRKKEETTAVK